MANTTSNIILSAEYENIPDNQLIQKQMLSGVTLVSSDGIPFDEIYVNASGDTISGSLTIEDGLNVSGDTELNDTTIHGDLLVKDADILSGETMNVVEAILDNETVTAAALNNLNSRINDINELINDNPFVHVTGDTMSGPLTIENTLEAAGSTLLKDTLNVSGATTLGDVLEVNNDTKIHGEIQVSDLDILSGKTMNIVETILEDEYVTATALNDLNNKIIEIHDFIDDDPFVHTSGDTMSGYLTIQDTLDVSNETTLHDALMVEGKTTINDEIEVGGIAQIHGEVSIDEVEVLSGKTMDVAKTIIDNEYIYTTALNDLNDRIVEKAEREHTHTPADLVTTINLDADKVDGFHITKLTQAQYDVLLEEGRISINTIYLIVG